MSGTQQLGTKDHQNPTTKSDRIQFAYIDLSGRRRVASIRVQPQVRREWDAMFEEYRQLLPRKSRAQVLEIVFTEMEKIPFWRKFFELTDKNRRSPNRGRPPKHFKSIVEGSGPQPMWASTNPSNPVVEIHETGVRLPSWMSRPPVRSSRSRH